MRLNVGDRYNAYTNENSYLNTITINKITGENSWDVVEVGCVTWSRENKVMTTKLVEFSVDEFKSYVSYKALVKVEGFLPIKEFTTYTFLKGI